MSDFYPISPLVGITNTSYAAQAGVLNEQWACRIVRGKKILAEKTIHQLDLESYVGVIYGNIRLEGLGRHAVAQCAGRLMQFCRKYQTAGVAPNYEVPDLVYDDGSSPAAATSDEVSAEDGAALGASGSIEDISVSGVGAVPNLVPLAGNDLWQNTIHQYGVMLAEMAAYGGQLPKGHLEVMFDNAANEMIRLWSASGEGVDVITHFGNMILSCSKESQLPAAAVHQLKIETGRCELLAMARELDPDGRKLPPGYPCTFHEKLASKVSKLTGAKIEVNTSSTGCIVQITLDLG